MGRNEKKLRKLLRERKPITCINHAAYVVALSLALQMSVAGISVTPAAQITKGWEK